MGVQLRLFSRNMWRTTLIALLALAVFAVADDVADNAITGENLISDFMNDIDVRVADDETEPNGAVADEDLSQKLMSDDASDMENEVDLQGGQFMRKGVGGSRRRRWWGAQQEE